MNFRSVFAWISAFVITVASWVTLVAGMQAIVGKPVVWTDLIITGVLIASGLTVVNLCKERAAAARRVTSGQQTPANLKVPSQTDK